MIRRGEKGIQRPAREQGVMGEGAGGCLALCGLGKAAQKTRPACEA